MTLDVTTIASLLGADAVLPGVHVGDVGDVGDTGDGDEGDGDEADDDDADGDGVGNQIDARFAVLDVDVGVDDLDIIKG